SASSPDNPPFVKKGDKVKKGDVLCIIEAMKLMNDIDSDVDGEIVEVFLSNEAVVEYGQPLFKVKIK
ncbi:MAG: acetyl-CoA carboxylase, biotin carboxyl carrier protein, partial [Vallitaleaceae bacterium]|nr:acetyl-CoA carboxylase, biotin carboxyl carrier protein [Vallitaleaceae bacterium]